MVLTQKPLGQWNRDPGNKSTYIWSINLWQRRQEHTMEKTFSSGNNFGKIGQPHVEEWNLTTILLPYTKNKFKMD